MGRAGTQAVFPLWAKAHNLAHAALMQPFSSKYVITDAYGIDAETFGKSISPIEFWNSALKGAEHWRTAEAREKVAEPFFQFLSPTLKNAAAKLSFLKLNKDENPPIMIVVRTTPQEKLFAETQNVKSLLLEMSGKQRKLESAEKEQKSFFLIVSAKIAIEEAAGKFYPKDNPFFSKISEPLFEEIFALICERFSKNHICRKGKNQEIKIALYSTEKPDIQLYQAHISKMLEPILGDKAKKLLVIAAGDSQETPVRGFLEG